LRKGIYSLPSAGLEMSRFDSVKYDRRSILDIGMIKARFIALELEIDSRLDDSHWREEIFMQLEATFMFVGKAVAVQQAKREKKK